LVKWLWDKHSEYFNPKWNQMFISSLSWDFEGIWAVVSTVPLWVKVESSIKGSPAKLNDVRIWDIIISANGTSLKGLTVSEAVDYIKWPSWTSVTLEIVRDWESWILMKELIRDAIKIPSVDYEKFEDYWYISINMFWDNTSNEFKEVLNNLTNTKWIVIDLRDNWWWYLLSATEILSNLVQRWEKLVITKYKGNSRPDEYYKSINNWSIYNWKIVVLINEISASASEIVAWALKDLGLAILVGKKSYWKGSVQQPFQLTDWSMVKLTTAKWFTPLWTNIDEEWITPDIEINFINEDYENLYDRQKEEAKKILKKFVKIWNIEKVISDFAIEIP
jgi:carboxyl-terminal processing protease